MNSLFNASENQNILNRINQLSAGTEAQWGKMKVAQMLAHCQVPLRVAAGEHLVKRGLIGILFGAWAKKSLLKDKPFDKNMPTEKSFRITDDRDFEKEKALLLSLVERFARLGKEGLTQKPHPFFGKLTDEEWDILQWKHLDHHLKQFGV